MKKEHFEILLEEMNSKLTLVLEGHEVLRKAIDDARDESNAKHDHTAFVIDVLNKDLNKKIDDVKESLSARIDKVEGKIDAVAEELAAHRADTEAHRDVYRVKEKDEQYE